MIDPVEPDVGVSCGGNGRMSGHAILAKLSWAMRSDPGEVRPRNEDYCGVFAPTVPEDAWDRDPLFVVADGLGGHAGGEVASRTAVDATLRAWTGGSVGSSHRALRAAIGEANAAVFDAAGRCGHRDMATTLTVMTVAGREAIIGHVGHSRCYLVRGGSANQLTWDHSRAGEMLRAGLISPAQAARHPGRSMLSRTVGSEASVPLDIIGRPTRAGDVFVLCSNGLWEVIARRDLTGIVERLGTPAVPTVSDAADRLIELALARRTADNATIVVVRIATDRPLRRPSPTVRLLRRR